MAAPSTEWFGRHRRLIFALFAPMLVVIAAESLLLQRQWALGSTTKAQSARLQAMFLKGDTAQAVEGASVHIRLQNVRFKWSWSVPDLRTTVHDRLSGVMG
jgi:hypothetical protein